MNEYSTCVVGIDLGDRTPVACIRSPGVVVAWFEFAMTPEGVRAAFEGKSFRAFAMEQVGSRAGRRGCCKPRLQPARRQPAEAQGDLLQRAQE